MAEDAEFIPGFGTLRLGSGPKGRWFKSTRPDHFNPAKRPVKTGRLVVRHRTTSIDGHTRICDSYKFLHIGTPLRTNIEIDDRLMRQALRSSGARTKRAVVEEALRLLIQTRGQRSIRRLRGNVIWEGDLDTSRLERAAK